jgi:DNA-binding NtrC family response regulator
VAGNIRELENVTERIAVLVAGANLTPVALQRELQAAVPELFSGDHGTAIEMSDGAPRNRWQGWPRQARPSISAVCWPIAAVTARRPARS